MRIVEIISFTCWIQYCLCENGGAVEEASKRVNGTKSPIEIYRNLFKMKRKEQILMIEKVILMDDVEKQNKMIGIMLKGIIQTIAKGKEILTEAQFEAGASFPVDNKVKDGYSMVLESTALFTDLIVRFPFISGRELKKLDFENWKDNLKWAKDVCAKSGVFVEKHERILTSLGQEMKFDEPDPGYHNPFRHPPKNVEMSSEERQKLHEERKRKEKIAAKKKKKTAPKLTKSEL